MPQKKPSDTMRIDLIPDRTGDGEGQPKKPLASFTRMDWKPPTRTLHYVARSQYKELLQGLYDATLVTNLEGDITDVNSRAEEFLQYDSSDLCKMGVTEVIHGSDESLLGTLRDSLERDRHCVIEAYCRRSDETTFPAEIAVNKLRLEEPSLCFFIRDITVRMQTQEMLQLEHNALQIAGSGIVIANLDAVIDYANPAFARLLGIDDPDTLIEGDSLSLFADRDAAESMLGQVLQTEDTLLQEMAMRHSGGGEVFAQVSATCNRNADGQPLGIVLSFADVTAHLRAQDALAQRVADQTTEYEQNTDRLRQEIAELKGS